MYSEMNKTQYNVTKEAFNKVLDDIEAEFKKAQDDVRTLTSKPTNEELLLLYGLYKQATLGNNTSSAPFLNPKATAKWGAWTEQHDRNPKVCMRDYINLVHSLIILYR